MAVVEQQSNIPAYVATRPQSEALLALRRTALLVLRVVLYTILTLIFLVPFIWMIFGSVRDEKEIFQYLYPFSWHTFFPVHWTLEHYMDILGISDAGKRFGLNFGRNLLNSAIVSTGVVICSLLFNTMGAYFFARLNFPKKNWLLAFVLVTLFVPLEVTMVPLYIVVRALHLQNSYWAMIVPWFASPFVIFALIQYFRDIPYELDEAALLDGASYFRILRTIIVPLAIPGLVTMALLEFQFIWNLFYWPLIAVQDNNLQVLQVAISSQTTQQQTFWGRTFAGSALASVPVIIIFLALQRYYIRGVASTGIKG
ncbi:MAG: carbohydrate ABC transporter permease [Thermomicrobiales bacterium]|nr:carbohydrate ABC transporter permease [Thermomicrobiales bacterium]